MKKNYQPPRVMMETFDVSSQADGCTAVQIGLINSMCVIQDKDSTPGMVDFAFYGGFLGAETNGCQIPVPEIDPETGDGLCYHTSVAMVFTS